MLETAEERIKLLKAGFTSKMIEELYIKYNNIKIVRTPVLFEFDIAQSKKACISHDVFAGLLYAKHLYLILKPYLIILNLIMTSLINKLMGIYFMHLPDSPSALSVSHLGIKEFFYPS